MRVLSIFLLTLLLLSGGCSSSKRVSLSLWQRDVDQYAANHRSGDMSFLRDAITPGSPFPQFSSLGSRSPDESSDVVGVFVGREMIDSQPWLVFVLGQLKNRQLEDIRLAARSDDLTAARWMMNTPDTAALASYRGDTRRWSPNAIELFPRESDLFRVQTFGRTIQVSEERSGRAGH